MVVLTSIWLDLLMALNYVHKKLTIATNNQLDSDIHVDDKINKDIDIKIEFNSDIDTKIQ